MMEVFTRCSLVRLRHLQCLLNSKYSQINHGYLWRRSAQTWSIATKPLIGNSHPIFWANKKITLISTQQRWHSSKNVELTIDNPQLEAYLNKLLERYIKLQAELVASNFKNDAEKQAVHKEMTTLQPTITALRAYNDRDTELTELQNIGEGMSDSERKELEAMTTDDVKRLCMEMETLADAILASLVPPDRADHNNVVVEVSAGVGGGEAFLFAKEILDMYTNYASYKGWQWDVTSTELMNVTEGAGGIRKGSIMISGEDVYRNMKYEGGVHRVQRVPKTERQGRMHTSTVTVAILPQPTEIDVTIHPKDLKIDTFKSQGAGGQHVNTTDSAVRIKHIPTGVVVECQNSRSQIENRKTAMIWLRSRIYEKELETQVSATSQTRKIQIGTSGRSEKIRTYNYKQDRITDHRLSENLFDVEEFLLGEEMLAHLIDTLHHVAYSEQVLELIEAAEQRDKPR